jgi:hypothetical protein
MRLKAKARSTLCDKGFTMSITEKITRPAPLVKPTSLSRAGRPGDVMAGGVI